jgi:transcriptional regulator with XRE-family HTH domain
MHTQFSRRLDILLETKLWTQSELVKKTGISHQTISKWKTQDRQPNSRSLDKIVQATGVSRDWLISGTDQMLSRSADDKDQVFMKLGEVWKDLSEKQKEKIMIIADLLPPEIEAIRPSPPYRKNLCDWIITSAAKYAGLSNYNIASLPPAMRDYIRCGLCDARCFWNCVYYYSGRAQNELDALRA